MIGRSLSIIGMVFLTSAAWARETLQSPDFDMLEYLGTFETSGGKAVDPVDIMESPQTAVSRNKLQSPGKKDHENKKKTKKAGIRKNPIPNTNSTGPNIREKI